VPDSCHSLAQFRFSQLGNPVKTPLYDPLKAGDQPLGFTEIACIFFSGHCRFLGRVGLSPSLYPLHPSELGTARDTAPKPLIQPQASLDDEVGQIVRQGTHEPVTGNTKPDTVPLHDHRVTMRINTGHVDLHARSLDLSLRRDEPTIRRDHTIFGILLK
jgi:hypothetical protein